MFAQVLFEKLFPFGFQKFVVLCAKTCVCAEPMIAHLVALSSSALCMCIIFCSFTLCLPCSDDGSDSVAVA